MHLHETTSTVATAGPAGPAPVGPAAHDERCPEQRARRRRLVGLVVLAAGASLVGTGAFASWQVTTSASSATLKAASNAVTVLDASSGGQLNLAVSDLVPGDWLYRYVDVTNGGTVSGAFTGQLQAAGLLGSGLTSVVDTCPVAWNTTASTCSTTPTTRGSGALTSPVTLTYGTIAPGAVQHVRIRVDVLASAPTTLMGKDTTVVISAVNDLVGNRDRTTG